MTFPENIAKTLETAYNESTLYDGHTDIYMVDAQIVLGLPDMVALRKWLKHEATSDESNFAVPMGQSMRDWGLSEEFITWVLECPA